MIIYLHQILFVSMIYLTSPTTKIFSFHHRHRRPLLTLIFFLLQILPLIPLIPPMSTLFLLLPPSPTISTFRAKKLRSSNGCQDLLMTLSLMCHLLCTHQSRTNTSTTSTTTINNSNNIFLLSRARHRAEHGAKDRRQTHGQCRLNLPLRPPLLPLPIFHLMQVIKIPVIIIIPLTLKERVVVPEEKQAAEVVFGDARIVRRRKHRSGEQGH